MDFVIIAKDRKNSEALRMKTRPEHLAYLAKNILTIKMAGPIIEEQTPVGSLMIVTADNKEIVEQWLKNDPYNMANLFHTIEIHEMRITIWNQ